MSSKPKKKVIKKPAKESVYKVGVIGLGNMGRGIAKNLIKAGNEVFVWDISEEARKPYARKATIAEPHEMAGKCQMVIFVVPGSPEIDAMLKGKNSMLAKPKRGLVLYDFTTSDPVYTKKLAKRAAKKGVTYMDAGMTGGGAQGADEGTMTLMIGGDTKVFKRTAPMLAPVAKKLIHLGASGTGHTMKVVHNMITHTNFFALSEAAHLGRRAGIKLEDLIEVFNNGNARSFISERRFPDHIISETWDGRSRVYNLNKDVGMAIALADKLGATVNIGRDTYAYIQEAVRQGRSEEDFTRLYPDLEKLDKKKKAKKKTKKKK
ncbi:MAG: NAD(P)-dependent oxidoreductase [Rhodospirillaceae bacterium]|nr:NAD(P)-dependent oxidoreductase [Rhodospirillaceae bacterium]MBT4589058.1 NAD(P)-dependent oxidoreductase [Rhodospirillaceae bacterium]MBT4941341.1 NAD(P)-dependent oxidoreductase [Rhodospirillaceae bacterium]MBT5940923.1 NAD(P)-dependent oxidoreductase [Rhodospirillaceae bacterium]MBT7265703.1 NAD(P)-dependent oxidoreductase [Rhodospirillaceae bacterium]